MADATRGAADEAAATVVANMEVAILQKYVADLCRLLLDANEALEPSLAASTEVFTRFIADPVESSLFVHRTQAQESEVSFVFATKPQLLGEKTATLVLVKRGETVLEASRSPAAQLQLINLGEGSPLDVLHSLVKHSLSPFFKSFVSQASSTQAAAGPASGNIGISAVDQKFAELELSLYNCKQNVQIPHVVLIFNPEVKAAADAAVKGNRQLKVEDLGEAPKSANFLNAVQAGVMTWVKDIQKVTKLERIDTMPTNTDTAQEIRFWLELESELLSIDRQLKSSEADCTLAVLRQARRFHATAPIETDGIGLKKSLERVANYKPLMKDLPLNDLLTASDIPKISNAIRAIFEHLRKSKSSMYPIARYLRLLEALARDLCSKLLEMIKSRQILTLPYSEFEKTAAECRVLLSLWEENFAKFREILRDLSRKRRQGEEDLPIIIASDIKSVQDRLTNVRKFRSQHEELHHVISKVLPPNPQFNAIAEMEKAYEVVRQVDPFVLSTDGAEAWRKVLVIYEERIERVENHIKEQLRDRLAAAKNANEMFRVFSKFNALFVRPKIRGAIQEYQAQLIVRVKEDIASLHERFKQKYNNSSASLIAEMKDIPPVSGAIIWARQIERQLKTYMRRVEDVLGKRWESDIEGRKLKDEFDLFRQKLNTDAIFEKWVEETKLRHFEMTGRILDIVKKGSQLQVEVNFDQHIITLFKEVRMLQTLGYRPPISVIFLSSGGRQVYPIAIGLKEIIKNYTLTTAKITPDINLLIAKYKREVQLLVTEGLRMRWDALPKLDSYMGKLAASVSLFQEKVDDVLAKNDIIKKNIEGIRQCAYSSAAFKDYIAQIQKVVDELNLAAYSNLDDWCRELDKTLEGVFLARLGQAISIWMNNFLVKSGANPTQVARLSEQRKAAAARGQLMTIKRKTGGEEAKPTLAVDERYQVSITTTSHEIVIRNQFIQLNPPLEFARASLFSQFNAWMAVVTGLPRIQSARYDESLQYKKLYDEPEKNYRDLLVKLPLGTLDQSYASVQTKLREVQDYVKIWLQYQALWDMEPAAVYEKLGDDLDKWKSLLVEIRRSRTTFDTSETKKDFGAVLIKFGSVQANVNNKYDYWHKDILFNYGNRLAELMKAFHRNISGLRQEIESRNVETSSTPEIVEFILKLQEIKKQTSKWEADIERFGTGQQLLQRQRYTFPSDWLDFDVVDSEWQAFNDILQRKTGEINNEIPLLQKKIIAEGKSIEERIEALQADWSKEKPLGGAKFTAALEQLSIFHGRVSRLEEEVGKLRKARLALDLDDPHEEEKLKPISTEIADLKNVWSELAGIWKDIDAMKETPWNAVVPRKIRTQLEAMVGKLKQMPNKIRQYQAFTQVSSLLQQFLDHNGIVTDLRSEALKERHWKLLRKRLNVKWNLAELTLGDVWDSNLAKNETAYKEIITQAGGELALEEFLKEVKEFWQAFELDLVNYQRKCQLIRGWDELFGKLAEHVNSISAMKNSPFFKVFEEDAASWEEKLNKTHALFDVWIDVQRRWVYLEGIFSGSSDIRNLLPRESARFDTINTEFMGLMNRVAKTRLIMEVVNYEGIDKLLDRLSDLLAKIQKSLAEYLERQRSAFPRFYFIGDEDLLDVIGNSKELIKVQKHLKKMFSGISSLALDPTGFIINGMNSPEAETVLFKKPVNIKEHSTIDSWLRALESEMKNTLATLLVEAMTDLEKVNGNAEAAQLLDQYLQWIDTFPCQIVLLGSQISWCQNMDTALRKEDSGSVKAGLEAQLVQNDQVLRALADRIVGDLPAIRRKKYEQLITDLVHQRDVTRKLIKTNVRSASSFEWMSEMRFVWNPREEKLLKKLQISIANANFDYGFEYLGVADRLVQTPLTDRCYLTLTQALESRMGGSPYGPAGTGKTETVKAMAQQMGRLVFVFCCDEGFDFQAMSRIFVGLCMCGAWGCFDEFNRLEERILSAVSQQIQTIQVALKERSKEVDLTGKRISLNEEMAIFVTMNPGYAGRSNLPDNLKQLFRGIAMITPDRELIAQVMLYSQGFKTAERLSTKVVPLFELCDEQLSSQSHYDFGLRALKSVLVSAGNLKRYLITEKPTTGEVQDEVTWEQGVLIQSVCENIIPKLVAEDIPLFRNLLSDVFPGASAPQVEMKALRQEIDKICKKRSLVASTEWVDKILQLYQIQLIRHGVMLVGPTGSGKTTAWTVLLEALEATTKTKSESYVLDPKAITKDQLFGSLESTTREWTDGLFTAILRKIIDNLRGESERRHWIIFDGDVDPEWVENLNALLDDNKLLTLPNGERLALPENVRIIFEVQDLKYATLATVSRCGMIWYNEETVTNQLIFENFIATLRNVPLDEQARASMTENSAPTPGPPETTVAGTKANLPFTEGLLVQRQCADWLAPMFSPGGLIEQSLINASSRFHIMEFTRLRVLNSMMSLINRAIMNITEYNARHTSPLPTDSAQKYITNRLLFAVIWGFGGSMNLKDREDFSRFVQGSATTTFPASMSIADAPPMLDFVPNIEDGEWRAWKDSVPRLEIETHQAASPDVVIPTIDTIRHVEVVKAWLSEHRPLLLCGPPGSGKTMTLEDTLRALPDYELISLNFSSATSPELLMKTFEHHCEYKKTPKGTILRPTQPGKWMVVFCDEINLPQEDKYGTQRVITFIRQMVEKGGFWRTSDHTWITTDRIQFLGACNPPTDPGRVPLSPRFLRHAPLLYVDFPSRSSLQQIYGTFNKALLKLVPDLRNLWESLTDAMVEFYLESQRRFTPDQHAHYIYSPRELTRWVRALREAFSQWQGATLADVVRLFVHEALRLFQDRLVTPDERKWTDEMIDSITAKYFPSVDPATLQRPILFSNWLTKEYKSVDRTMLRDHVKARLKVFYEEELDVPLVLFNEVLDHILRIDRVFRQPQGHALLIGVSGGGKTVLSRFVAWMNGLSIFTIKVNNKYSMPDFDDDLRHVMKRAGVEEEKICFIFDESNVLQSNFLERMNTLLAGGEVPGLFEGDEYTALMHQLREATTRRGLILDSEAELYKWFTQQVRKNLHVVFTMNPASPEFHNRAATSPALFNRCVLDWFGEWSDEALFQVGQEFTNATELGDEKYKTPDFVPANVANMAWIPMPLQHRDAVIASLVYVHKTIDEANRLLVKQQGRQNYVTPRHYLDFIKQFVGLVNSKREELVEQQLHLNVGLDKLRETEKQVKELQASLAKKNTELEEKKAAANAKLKVMVEDQQKAEVKQKELFVVQEQVDRQNKEIAEQKKIAYADLEKAEPALLEAQKAVQGISRKNLDEIKTFNSPPAPVRLTMEAVMLMLYGKKLDWTATRKVAVESSFIPTILGFESSKMTAKVRKQIRDEYMKEESFNYENVNKANKACGPMVKWVIAQVEYSEIVDKVQPLREKVAQLEDQAKETAQKAVELDSSVADITKSIAKYKEDYAILISQTQEIKAEMSIVESKVNRSIALLQNLSSERVRWERESKTFDVNMSTVIGDSMLSGAFLAYSGFFDQFYRNSLIQKWKSQLESVAVKFEPNISVIEYLSHPDDRLKWHAKALPVDDLCIENAIMLHRFNRYPLVIDPSGQATEFMMNYYKEKKITKTSFLDSSFMKNLESALRFGTPLLVEDVESIDPVLNPVLNKEIRKTGGRVLIRLGDNDVDFSPSFVIFLSTRDPTAHFTPDLCSRVTFVNFTVTPKSLQSQCLHNVLKAEQPAIYKKRLDLISLQGEFRVKLRNLERSLLNALNESQGNILDDDKVMSSLEKLKREAADIHAQVDQADKVMEDIKAVSELYRPIAAASSHIYFTMEQLAQVHFLYQFSLSFFLDVFNNVLHNNPKLEAIKDEKERIEVLIQDLFASTYKRVSRSLLHDHRIALALRMAQIRLKGTPQELSEQQFDFLMRGGSRVVAKPPADPVLDALLNEQQRRALLDLQEVEGYKNIGEHIAANRAAWQSFLTSPTAENEIPAGFVEADQPSEIYRSFNGLLILKVFRLDRLLAGIGHYVSAAMGPQFIKLDEFEFLDVFKVRTNIFRRAYPAHLSSQSESRSSAPLLLCSTPGFDPSGKVDDLAAALKPKVYRPIAIGSAEGFDLADKSITSLTQTGGWVHLKNIHLAPQWLNQLEKRLHQLKPHPEFRLFCTSDIHPQLPANLLRISNIFVFEPPPGIKANLQQTLAEIPAERMDQAPAERSRLYFLLAWFHAIVIERLRYAPFGWSKQFEFNNTDKKNALETINYWVDSVAKGRSNVDPETIPWQAIRSLLGQTIYGGRIDNPFDQRLLDSLLAQLFKPQSFDLKFSLINTPRAGRDPLVVPSPEGSRRAELLSWIDKLPDSESPAWLGLPDNAELLLLQNKAQATLQRVLKMQTLDDDSATTAEDIEATSTAGEQKDNRPAWVRALEAACHKWLEIIPKGLKPIDRKGKTETNPLLRFFDREMSIGSDLLNRVSRDLRSVIQVCVGELKQTNYLRVLMSTLAKGGIPSAWQKDYTVSADATINDWILDFSKRITALEKAASATASADSTQPIRIWLGGLFNPDAFITATRQRAARSNSWSLENLELEVDVLDTPEKESKALSQGDGASFIVEGLRLQGAGWKSGIALSTDMAVPLPLAKFSWVNSEQKDSTQKQLVPVYLNETRKVRLFAVEVPCPAEISAHVWFQRGVVLCASNI